MIFRSRPARVSLGGAGADVSPLVSAGSPSPGSDVFPAAHLGGPAVEVGRAVFSDTAPDSFPVALAGGVAVRKADAAQRRATVARQPACGRAVDTISAGSIGKPAPHTPASKAAVASLLAAITPAIIRRFS